MKNINFNEFKKLGFELEIEDKRYKVQFIPYTIEKEIYKSIENINTILSDITKIKDEDMEKFQTWIYQILSHKKNENEITKEIFDDMGMTDIIAIMIAFMNFITRRVQSMTNIIAGDELQKKTENLN